MSSNNTPINPNFSRTDFVEVAGTQIACHRHGTGPPVICLHAIGHSGRDFAKLSHDMADSYEFIALDWPGHGVSAKVNTLTNAENYAHLLEEVIRILELENYILIGNSIGGAAAIIHAAAFPNQVRALVLCNPGGLQPVNLLTRLYCRYMAGFFAKGERGASGFAKKFKRYYEKTVLPEPEAAWRRNEIIADSSRSAPALAEAWTHFADSKADIRKLTPKLSMPILYAWARGDRAVAWRRCKKAAQAAPNYQVSLFKGGHSAFLEDPLEFNNVFSKFVARV